MAPFIAGVVSMLIQNNLPKVAQAVVDKGMEYVEEKTGIKLEPNMSAEKIAELRVSAIKHEEFRIEQDNKNTANARDLQKVALQQDDLFSKRFLYYLTSFWSAITALYIGFITFGTIPPDNIRFADTILGFLLGTVIATIMNYFLGSSKGSADKNDLLRGTK
jgi:hypothetical protein